MLFFFVTAVVIFVVIPSAGRARNAKAKRMLDDASRLQENGRYTEAIRVCRRLRHQYAGTAPAARANEFIGKMSTAMAKAQALCDEADAAVQEDSFDSLAAGLARFQEIIKIPPVPDIGQYRTYAKNRIELLREEIAHKLAARAAAHEKRSEWHEALKCYRLASDKYEYRKEPIRSGLLRASRQVEAHVGLLGRARRASKARRWEEAADLCRKALDTVPTDPAANELLAALAPKLKPPSGMVLVPPGKYKLGGVPGNPKRTVVVPHGFFIDTREVTNKRYAEFLRAKGGDAPPPPRDWDEQRRPPEGAGNLPVVGVTWEEAAAFAAWAGCTLPTEGQWECAARGQSGRDYAWKGAWNPKAAVLAFAPAPVGAAPKDRTPAGCMDMIGNVAEWTATRVPASMTPKRALRGHRGPGRAGTTYYFVKGNSWAGVEADRMCFMLLAPEGSRQEPPRTPPLPILVPGPENPEARVNAGSVQITYLRQLGSDKLARVRVRIWMPKHEEWAEGLLSVTVGDEIRGTAYIRDERGRERRTPRVKVEVATGCVARRQEVGKWLEIQDPMGILRRLPCVKERGRSRTTPSRGPDPFMRSQATLLWRTSWLTPIRDVARCATRMVGRASGRYRNVGFRCVKMLWSPAKN